MISDKTTDITSSMSTAETKIVTDFKLADVTVDVTVMEGLTTSNHLVRGTVRQIIPGVCVVVDQGPWSQISYLWRSLAIVEGAAPVPRAIDQEIVVDDMTLTLPAMRRTDSGADYGFNGYPDCAWWLSQGVHQPLFVATPFHYERSSYPLSPLAMATILDECKDKATEEGGVFLEAWKRQLSEITLMDLASDAASSVVTPPTSPGSSSVACPDAPRKLRLDIPSLEDHRGLGILPGDFIKPDPVLTRSETRRYLLDEFERYMTGPIQSRARACFGAHLTLEEIGEEVEAGLWPAARLYRLRQALEEAGKLPEEEVELQFDHVARWILGVVRGYVTAGVPLTDPLEVEAMAFLTVDLLPGGRTIDSFWNRSPFEALRSAPPLTEEHEATDAEEHEATEDTVPDTVPDNLTEAEEADDEATEDEDDSDDSDYDPDEDEEDAEEDDSLYVSDEDTEEDEETEEEEEETTEAEYVTTISLGEVLQREVAVHVKIPAWAPLAGFTALVAYLWIVGFVSGRC